MKKSIITLILYILFILLTSFTLNHIINSIPMYDSTLVKDSHPFDNIDETHFLSYLILVSGIYLYPLHIIFINKSIMNLKPAIFIPVSIFFIFLTHSTRFWLNLSVDSIAFENKPIQTLFSVGLFLFLYFLSPFLIVYFLKYLYYKLNQSNTYIYQRKNSAVNTKKNFILYNICIIILPFILLFIISVASSFDIALSENSTLEKIQAREILSILILGLGTYLYPLHIVFLDKAMLDIKPNKLIKIVSISISIFPIIISLVIFSLRAIPLVIAYIFIFLLAPFLIIYSIKYIYYKKYKIRRVFKPWKIQK